MYLESLDLLAVAVVDEHALESDVCDLDARARVGAAVEVERDRYVEFGIEFGQAGFEFRNEVL